MGEWSGDFLNGVERFSPALARICFTLLATFALPYDLLHLFLHPRPKHPSTDSVVRLLHTQVSGEQRSVVLPRDACAVEGE